MCDLCKFFLKIFDILVSNMHWQKEYLSATNPASSSEKEFCKIPCVHGTVQLGETECEKNPAYKNFWYLISI